jgi:septal ring factor EnvC (AmiA/AmiB activator)
MTELSLPDTVIALQRLDLLPETREVVEEAARLLQDGREMEARALVEKAEALAAQALNGKANGNGNGYGKGISHDSGYRWAGAMIGPIAEKLATGFTAVLTSVLEDIYQHTGNQVQVVASVLEERIHGIEEAIQRTSTFEERFEQVAAEQEALRHAHEETSGAVDLWHQAGLESRLAAVEERVTGIDQIVRDLQPQVSTVMTRLDRQTDVLRSLEQRHAQRVSALNHVLDNLSRLREEEPAPENSLPLM